MLDVLELEPEISEVSSGNDSGGGLCLREEDVEHCWKRVEAVSRGRGEYESVHSLLLHWCRV